MTVIRGESMTSVCPTCGCNTYGSSPSSWRRACRVSSSRLRGQDMLDRTPAPPEKGDTTKPVIVQDIND